MATCLVPGTGAHELAGNLPTLGASPMEIQVDIENPAGILSATIEGQQTNLETKITRPPTTVRRKSCCAAVSRSIGRQQR